MELKQIKSNREIFEAWAPDDALWTQWAKPVLFACLPNRDFWEPEQAQVDYGSALDARTMVVVDLPGERSVTEGLALAQMGLRPVPLYNGVYGPVRYKLLVNVRGIASALQHGAQQLADARMRPDAAPAFLLDWNRMTGRGKQPGSYDNRWCVFPQDMPSAEFLSAQGIRRVLVRGAYIQNDLSHILLRYQKGGIEIMVCGDDGAVKSVKVVRPSRFRSLLYRFSVTLGLRRNATGGFGAAVPEPVQTHGGGVYFRYG